MENEKKTPKIVSNVITESPLENSNYWRGEGNFGEIQELKRKIDRLEVIVVHLIKSRLNYNIFVSAAFIVVFLYIGHFAHWL